MEKLRIDSGNKKIFLSHYQKIKNIHFREINNFIIY